MIIFQFSASARKKFRLPELPRAAADAPAHAPWHVHVFRVQRYQYVLTTHAATLYSIVQAGRGLTDDGAYVRSVLQRMREQMRDDKLEVVLHWVLRPQLEIQYARATDRSLTGSVNDAAATLRVCAARRDATPNALSAELNDRPCGALAYRTPLEAMRGLL